MSLHDYHQEELLSALYEALYGTLYTTRLSTVNKDPSTFLDFVLCGSHTHSVCRLSVTHQAGRKLSALHLNITRTNT